MTVRVCGLSVVLAAVIALFLMPAWPLRRLEYPACRTGSPTSAESGIGRAYSTSPGMEPAADPKV